MPRKDYYAPAPPARNSKMSKDRTGRLMHIIAELSVTKNNDDRKQKMTELKRDFDASDAKLVKLISEHRELLPVITDSFSRVSAMIRSSKQSCQEVKMKLLACKTVLECKTHEIRRLWSESVEHREVINVMREIENLNSVHDKVNVLIEEKKFIEASEILVTSMSLLEDKLADADALKEVKAELKAVKKKLYQVLIEELQKHIYMSRTKSVECDIKNDTNSEGISIILKCIVMLQKLPETVEILKEKCSLELSDIIRNSSKKVYDEVPNLKKEQQKSFLLNLLETILDQFRSVGVSHRAILNSLQGIDGAGDVTEYEIDDIYSKIQAALEQFVADYLDVHNTTTAQATTFAKQVPSSDISSFFLRKGMPRAAVKHSLFKFDSSAHAINQRIYEQERKEQDLNKDKLDVDEEQVLICQPSIKNVTVIYKPLKNFIAELETELSMEPSNHCLLHAFLGDCVKMFLDDVNIEMTKTIEKATVNMEKLAPFSNREELKVAEAASPQILTSVLILNACLKETQGLMNSLPDYSNHFMQLMLNVLQSYQELSSKTYEGVICLSSEENRIFSISWAQDEDISRLLRSLPNWANLKTDEVVNDDKNFEESPEEIRFRNKEESELLMRNLFSKTSISPCEIISDHTKLKNLALMHESMEYLSFKILNLAESFKSSSSAASENSEDASTKDSLKKLSGDFNELADASLLVLHLEVRVHCFYYLLQLSRNGCYVSSKVENEPELQVVRLNADLSKIHESLSLILQPKKMKYIFEGLGELLSTIFINCVSNIKRVNENGIKKMGRNIFAIQQNLSSVTMTRDVALDRASQFYDLLNLTCDDVLNKVVEGGPKFQKNEYSSLLQLLHNSKDGMIEQKSISSYLEKLKQILDEVAVAV